MIDSEIHGLGHGYRGYIKLTKRYGWIARLVTGGPDAAQEVDKHFNLESRDEALEWLRGRVKELTAPTGETP